MQMRGLYYVHFIPLVNSLKYLAPLIEKKYSRYIRIFTLSFTWTWDLVYIMEIIHKSYFLFERKKYKFRCINSSHAYAIYN